MNESKDRLSLSTANNKKSGILDQVWARRLFRLGYYGKGVVYLGIGLFTIGFPFSGGEKASGTEKTLERIAAFPGGQYFMISIGMALIGYASWKLAQAVLDTEDKGWAFKGVVARLSFLFSATIHLFLSYSCFSLSHLIYDSNGAGDRSPEELLSGLVGYPENQIGFAICGLILVAVGGRHFQRVWKLSFMDSYSSAKLSKFARVTAIVSGVIGLGAEAA